MCFCRLIHCFMKSVISTRTTKFRISVRMFGTFLISSYLRRPAVNIKMLLTGTSGFLRRREVPVERLGFRGVNFIGRTFHIIPSPALKCAFLQLLHQQRDGVNAFDADLVVFAASESGADVIFRISEDHDRVIAHLSCPFEGIKPPGAERLLSGIAKPVLPLKTPLLWAFCKKFHYANFYSPLFLHLCNLK